MLNNFITDFNPPVKRPGMHKNRMIRHSVYALCSETEVLMISLSIKFKSLMTFKLNSEHHHRISFFYRFVERKFLNKGLRSEEHTSELQSRENLVCRLLLEKKKQ